MNEKIALVMSLFTQPESEETPVVPIMQPLKHGNYYGGVYNGRKFMYSEHMINTMPIDKLEAFILNQIGA